MTICDCDANCGFEIGSLEFIRFHVESEEEQEHRLASEQHLAEQEVMQDIQDNLKPHGFVCGCVECN